MKSFLFLFCVFFTLQLGAQIVSPESDSVELQTEKPLVSINTDGVLKDFSASLYMRLGFLNHTEDGRNDNFTEFRNGYVALGLKGKLFDKVGFVFRQRFNKSSELQSLDVLDNSIELAYADLSLSPKLKMQLGKMYAYFGGYEYEFNPIDVLEYNDVSNNLLAYVTGVGLTYQLLPSHSFGFQVLNSRTMRYSDLYEGKVDSNVSEPRWPVAWVLNWRGKFLGGKFETIYSFSNFKIAKGHATTVALSLGNKFSSGKFSIMYDYNLSNEQLDTKGIVTSIMKGPFIAQDALYSEHWLRTEYKISPQFQGLLTLMMSDALGKNKITPDSGYDHLRTSYGVIPTLYYKPFKQVDVRFYVAYIGRFFQYSHYARNTLQLPNYSTHEIQLGFMAPLWIF